MDPWTHGEVPRTQTGVGFDPKKSNGKDIVIEEFEVPVPTPGDDELLIHVANSSCNPVDWKLSMENWFNYTEKTALGRDLAGIVVKKGSAVGNKFKIGDQVVGYTSLRGQGSWYADEMGGYAISHMDTTAKLLPDTPMHLMALYPVAFLSAHDGLHGNLETNQRVFITSGAGGVGHFALQLAKLKTNRIITTAGREQSKKACLELGAEFVFNPKERKPVDAVCVKYWWEGKLADVVYDCSYDPEMWDRSAACVAEGGKWIVLYHNLADSVGRILHEITLAKGAKFIQADLVRYDFDEQYSKKQSFMGEGLQYAVELHHTGRCRPIKSSEVDCCAADIQGALETMRAGKHGPGKIRVKVMKAEEPIECSHD